MGGRTEINTKTLLLVTVLLVCSFACSQKPGQERTSEPPKVPEEKIISEPDTFIETAQAPIPSNDPMVRRAAKLIAQLKAKDDYGIVHGQDTLIDINGDGHRDLLIEYPAGSGTGFKDIADVYLFEAEKNNFNSQYITLPNPTFYFNQKRVTVYYIGLGGGDAYTLQWKGNVADTLEYIAIEVDNRKKLPVFTITTEDMTTGKTRRKISDEVALPSSYRYARYTPLIRRAE